MGTQPMLLAEDSPGDAKRTRRSLTPNRRIQELLHAAPAGWGQEA